MQKTFCRNFIPQLWGVGGSQKKIDGVRDKQKWQSERKEKLCIEEMKTSEYERKKNCVRPFSCTPHSFGLMRVFSSFCITKSYDGRKEAFS